MRVALFTVERQARVDVLTRFLGQTAKPPYRPCGVVRLQQDLRVIEFASEPEEIRRNPVRPIKPTPGVIELSTRWRWTARGRLSSRSPPNLGGTLHRFAHLRGGPSVKPTRRPRLETVRTLVSLLYQKGRDSRIFQAQDRAIDDFTLRGEALAGVYWPAGGARRRRSKLRQRRRAAGTLGLYRRRPSGVHGQQILAVTRDHLGIAVAAGDFVFAHPIPIAGRISAPDAQCNNCGRS